MKKFTMRSIEVLLFLTGCLLLNESAFSQCNPSGPTGNLGFLSPPDDSFPCINRGISFDENIYFENSMSDALGIDSIIGLPAGINWSTSMPNDTFTYGQVGCIRIFGLTNAPVGHYDLTFYISLWVNGSFFWQIPSTASLYVLKVKELADTCTTSSLEPFSVFMLNIPNVICAGDTATLKPLIQGGGNNKTYTWLPATGLSNASIANPVASPSVTTAYTLLVSDGIETVSGQVTITVQNCSGTCAPFAVNIYAGFYPYYPYFPCVRQGIPYSETIFFKNWSYPIDSLRFNDVTNLPTGLSWATYKPNNVFGREEVGCINISGTSTDPIDEYQLGFNVTLFIDSETFAMMSLLGWDTVTSGEISDPLLYGMIAAGNSYISPFFLRVTAATDSCPLPANCHANFIFFPSDDLPFPWDTISSILADTTPHHYFGVNLSTGAQPLTYSWNWGDGTYDSIAYPEHTYSDTGSYNICLTITDSTGCSDTYCNPTHLLKRENAMVYVRVLSFNDTTSNSIGMDGIIPDNISLYPNPTSGTITLKANIQEQVTLKLFDALGRLVWQQSLAGAQLKQGLMIDLKDESEGIYFLNIRTARSNRVMKVVRY